MLASLFNKVAGLQVWIFIKKRLQHRYFPVNIAKFLRAPVLKYICERLLLYFWNPNYKQETLCLVAIAMICSTLGSLWKSQYFQRPICNPVKDLWWSLHCENIKPLSIFTKSSIVDVRIGSKYTSALWRLFKHFIFLKDFSL